MNLLERCQRNIEQAWRELFSRYAGKIFGWAVLLGLPPSEAEDAAQDVLATAARRIRTCRAEEALNSWLFQITRRVVANHRRGKWFRRVADSREEQAYGVLSRELEARQCLRRLPDEMVEILVMVEIAGLTRSEAALILEIPAGTVASRLRRARVAFLEQWHEDRVTIGAEPVEEFS